MKKLLIAFLLLSVSVVWGQDRRNLTRLRVTEEMTPPRDTKCTDLTRQTGGSICYDSDDQLMYMWSGSAWLAIGQGYTACSTDPPTGSCSVGKICVDETNGNFYACISNVWTLLTGSGGGGGSGDVTGPTASVDNEIARFHSTTGKIIQAYTSTGPTVGDTGTLQLNTANFIMEGATADDFETTVAVTDPTGDRTFTIPDVDGTAVVMDQANVPGVNIVFEGATEDDFETTLQVADPTTPDKVITLPNATGVTVLMDEANTPGENIIFEGSTADAYETTLAVADPQLSSKTVTLPDATGLVVLQASSKAIVGLGSDVDIGVTFDRSGTDFEFVYDESASAVEFDFDGTLGEAGNGVTITATDLDVPGSATIDSVLTLTALDCTGNTNGGKLVANASGVVVCGDDAGGAGGSGDNIEVNGVAVADANFNDSNPAAATNGVLVKFDVDAATAPDEVSAYLLLTDIDGAGIGVSSTELTVDMSELDSDTIGTGTQASFTHTYDLSGTDPVVTYATGAVNVSTGELQEDGNAVVAAGDVPTGDLGGTYPNPTVVNTTCSGNNDYLDGTGECDTLNEFFSFTLESPADADNFLKFKAPWDLTVTNIYCIVDPADSSESVVITVQERNASGDSPETIDTVTCTNGGADGGSITNPSVNQNDWVGVDIGAVSGNPTVTQVAVTVVYTRD